MSYRSPLSGRRSLLLSLLVFLSAPLAADQRPAAPPGGGSFRYTDPRIGPGLPERAWSLKVQAPQPPARDPKYNEPYPYQLLVNCGSYNAEGYWLQQRLFTVYYLSPADEALARRIGGLAARLYWIGFDYLGRQPVGKQPIPIWLARHGAPGGEEYQGNIILFAVHEPRSAAEWVRELAHEYGHLTLPGAGPFTEPEPWANGYLGERLYQKWLLADNPGAGAWNEPLDGKSFVSRQVAPLREAFLNDGPLHEASSRMDAAGMRHYIGQMLALEHAYGPALLRRVFDRSATPRPQNVPGYLTLALGELDRGPIETSASAFIPARTELIQSDLPEGITARRAAYWLFVPPGDWTLELEGSLPPGIQVGLEATELSVAAGASGGVSAGMRVREPHVGWKRLELAAPSGEQLVIRKLALKRTG